MGEMVLFSFPDSSVSDIDFDMCCESNPTDFEILENTCQVELNEAADPQPMTTWDGLNSECLETRLQDEIFTTSDGTFYVN